MDFDIVEGRLRTRLNNDAPVGLTAFVRNREIGARHREWSWRVGGVMEIRNLVPGEYDYEIVGERTNGIHVKGVVVVPIDGIGELRIE
jgi:hypothetical protein